MLLEGLLSLVDSLRVVEIPRLRLRSTCWRTRRLLAASRLPVANSGLLLQHLFGFSLFAGPCLLLLFLDEFFYDFVYHLVALIIRHLGQPLQRVLQLDIIGMGHQFVEHF